jgi:xanthine dehydrogenase YagR molybdenum-binding subunit
MSIGQPTTRIEGPAKVTGAAKYAADHYLPNVLHAVTICSPIAAGRITGIDTAEASAVPGVARVLTAKEMPRLGKLAAPAAVSKPPMQSDVIEWEGQPVAMVLAETLEAAEEAASLVRVRVERTAAAVPTKGKLEVPPDGGFFPAKETKGDVERGLMSAVKTVKQHYFQPTRNHNPMETSATVAAWDGDRLTLWDSTQANINPPQVMSAAFGIPPENVRVISPHTGGGFGCKGYVWPHEVLAAAAARVVGRPVRLQLTRAQQYSQVGHQPECRQTVTLGADASGKLTAVRHVAINTTSMSDLQFEAPAMASRTYYASPNIETDQQVERINLVHSTPMRAPVEGPGSWALESAMDELAIELGIDPLDLRLQNFAEREPFDDKPWSSNKLKEAYAEAERVFGWRARHSLPKQDGVWTLGRGMSMASTFCARFPGKARVRVLAEGRLIVEASSNDIGTGNQTVFALIAAQTLGTTPDKVTVNWGDTMYPKAGPVYGSSHTLGTGGAVKTAALDARRKLAKFGAKTDGPLDLAAIMRRAEVAEIVGEGEFALGGAPAGMNGSGTPYAMNPGARTSSNSASIVISDWFVCGASSRVTLRERSSTR